MFEFEFPQEEQGYYSQTDSIVTASDELSESKVSEELKVYYAEPLVDKKVFSVAEGERNEVQDKEL